MRVSLISLHFLQERLVADARDLLPAPAEFKDNGPMIILAGLVLGVLIGTVTAKRRGGKALDIMQYGAGYGIAFCLVGVFLTIVLERSL